MSKPATGRRSPLGLFPEPAPRAYDRVVEVLRNRRCRFLVMPCRRSPVPASLDKSYLHHSTGGELTCVL